ncbi:MAG: glycosyltransferase family 2 protein [Pseudomonadota bacterium]
MPVINEGKRIQSLLKKCAAQKIHHHVDMIIVDGGSTDGSLAPNILHAANVCGLLIKTGNGKLSAQLRCAYAFALNQGYEGIITIDGNDKDDPTTIPQFIEALTKGVDFVQASRFIKGGIDINTPLIRKIAIQWIHAPFLRLSSGFPWTDTTQGYRAYSRRLLLDPEIAVFRDIFYGYELLYYLSHKLQKLHYRCVELPTKRSYPKDETPSKIAGIFGHFDFFMVLVKACLGCYDVKSKS